MSITSRISSMEEHVTNAYNGLQGLGADLTGIDKNIDNIASVLDDIYDDLPKATGSGTSITLDDTRKGRVNMEFSGNTNQFTTTGKNKLDLTGITTRTISAGITITPNFNGDLLQNIKISGTPTTTAWQTLKRITLPAGSYIMTGINISQTTKTGLRIGVYIDSARQYFINANSTSYSFTLEEETSMDYVVWVQNVDYYPTGDIYVFPMIRLSSVSDDTYEPFTNGASPNPDYPQEVHIVSGDNEINVTGRNLLEGVEYGDINAYTGIESSIETVIKAKNYMPYNKNATYYLSINNSSASSAGINLRFYNKNKEYIGYSTLTGSGTNFYVTITTSVSDTTPVYFRFRQTLSVGPITSLNDNVMITTVNDMTYEPYKGDTYPINLGVKNLWNSEDMKSGYLPQSGSYPTADPSYPNSRYIIVPLMKGQSITTYSEVTYSAFRIRYIDKDTNSIVGTVSVGENNGYCSSNATYQSGFANGTITATKDVLLGLWDFDGYMSTSGYYKITYGTKSQQISPTPIELAEISTYNDEIFRTSGKNLFDIGTSLTDWFQTGNNGITVNNMTINRTTATISGNTLIVNSYDTTGYTWISKWLTLNKNTDYIISGVNDNDIKIVGFSSTDLNTVGTLITTKTNSNTTKTFNSGDYNYYCLSFYPGTAGKRFENVQIESGSIATEYNPFGTGEWYYKEATNKVVLNGSESWNFLERTGVNVFQNNNLLSDLIRKSATEINIISDYFLGTSDSQGNVANSIRSNNTGQLYITIPNTNPISASTSAFTAWLENNNVNAYFILATPTYTKITSSDYPTLYSQLEAIYNAQGYDNQTNISQTNSDLPFKITASALKEWSV